MTVASTMTWKFGWIWHHINTLYIVTRRGCLWIWVCGAIQCTDTAIYYVILFSMLPMFILHGSLHIAAHLFNLHHPFDPLWKNSKNSYHVYMLCVFIKQWCKIYRRLNMYNGHVQCFINNFAKLNIKFNVSTQKNGKKKERKKKKNV